MRHLGIDFGTKKIGLALSDEAGTMGFPHSILANTPQAIDTLATLIAQENVAVVVVGASHALNGSDNPVAEPARAFAQELTARTGVPVRFESEVYTTAQARRAPEKQPKTRAPQKNAPVDASAAALILTSYLSKQTNDD